MLPTRASANKFDVGIAAKACVLFLSRAFLASGAESGFRVRLFLAWVNIKLGKLIKLT